MRVTGRPVTEPAGTAVGRLRTCGSSAVIASRIAGTGARGRQGSPHEADPPGTQKSRRRPIFPKGCPLSIFGAGELNFRVRDGNGCGLSAGVTRILIEVRRDQREPARRRSLALDDFAFCHATDAWIQTSNQPATWVSC